MGFGLGDELANSVSVISSLGLTICRFRCQSEIIFAVQEHHQSCARSTGGMSRLINVDTIRRRRTTSSLFQFRHFPELQLSKIWVAEKNGIRVVKASVMRSCRCISSIVELIHQRYSRWISGVLV